MKVTVKSIPVRYGGDRYLKGETFEINKKYFDENLFETVEATKNTEKSSTEKTEE